MSSLYAKLYAKQNAVKNEKKPVVTSGDKGYTRGLRSIVVDSRMDDIYNDLNTHCKSKNKKCKYADQFGDCPFINCIE